MAILKIKKTFASLLYATLPAKVNALYKQRRHFYPQNILHDQNIKKQFILTEISTNNTQKSN